MFNVRLKLQERKEPSLLAGPRFDSSKIVRISLDGSIISFRAPRSRAKSHIPGLREPRKSYKPLQPEYPNPGLSRWDDNWNALHLMGRVWDFFGPWFTGRLASVRCSISVLQGQKPEGTSYFHPRVFEATIMDRMAETYDQVFKGEQDRFVPSDWRPLTSYPCPAVYYIAAPNRKNCPIEDNDYYVTFPLHDDYFVSVEFSLMRLPEWINGKRDNDLEKWTPIAPMETLIHQIIDSIQVTLSPEAKQQMEKAQAGLKDTSLVKEFPPIDILAYQKNKQASAAS